jgi:hypothetical protein
MKITPRRTATLICAGAVAFAMTTVPAATAATVQMQESLAAATVTPTDMTVNSNGGRTYTPAIRSPFSEHGAVG